MPVIDVAAFMGITPMVGKEELPNEASRLAENCRLEGGDLEGWNAPLQIKALTSLSPVISIYRYGIDAGIENDFWFQWTTDVDCVRGPVAGDVEERTYWTGDGGYPKKTKADIATTSAPYPSNSYRLGIPAPISAPNVTITGTPTNPSSDPVTTSVWGFTYVTSWDEEGPMSPLSALGSWQPGQTPHLSSLLVAPGGPYTINRKRIYRSAAGTSSDNLQFVAELAIATTTYDDNVLTINLGRIAESRLWIPPPDSITGLCMMSGGFLAAFTGNTVQFSEPDVPYAWPAAYTYPFPGTVVGIKPFDQSLLVCTKRGTWVLTGAHPSSMSEQLVSDAGVCLSKRAMVSMGGGVLYPERLGLRSISASGSTLITAGAFDERAWAVYKPESWTAAQVNGRYVVSYDTGTVQGGLVFSFILPSAVVTTTVFGTAMWQEIATDRLYLVQDGGGSTRNILRWDGNVAAPLTYKWLSKDYWSNKPLSMACARVAADNYPVTLKVFAAGQLIHVETVASKAIFTLPGEAYSYYSFQIEGSYRVSRVQMATSQIELKVMPR